MSMAAMEATVVATAMPTLIAELGGVALYAWVGSAYLLASTVMMPLYGRLADTLGRKRVLLTGISLFLVGSLGAGFAPSIEVLVAARVLQGLGAAGMQPIALTMVGDLFSIAERSKVQGLFGAVWATAGVLGPMIGAFFVHALSWRWVFWVNLPFGLASMLVLARCYHEGSLAGHDRRLDVAGAALITLASVALLLGTSLSHAAWLLPVGLVLAAFFVRVELRVPSPMLPISLVTRRPIAVASSASFLLGAILMALLLFLPLYVQGARGRTPLEAGLAVAPAMIGWPIASTLTSRWLVHAGFRAPLWAGALVVALSSVGLALAVGFHVAIVWIGVSMFFFGVGNGLANTALLIAVQSTVGFAQRGVATALSLFARTMGGALGVGILGALVTRSLAKRLAPEEVAALLMRHGDAAALEATPEMLQILDAALLPLFIVCAALATLNLAVVAAWPRILPLADEVHERIISK